MQLHDDLQGWRVRRGHIHFVYVAGTNLAWRHFSLSTTRFIVGSSKMIPTATWTSSPLIIEVGKSLLVVLDQGPRGLMIT